jgi:MFS family permease
MGTVQRLRSVGPPGGSRSALAVLALAQLVFSLDLNIMFVALPRIGAALGFSSQTEQWVVSAYVVLAGGFMLLGGRISDALGRRRAFVGALVLYALSSLAGGLAPDQAVIVLARAMQGIGGALLLPATLGLLTTLFEEGPARNRALAVWGGAGASGLSVGALLGGVLTQELGWPAVFFVNVPLAGLAALAALRVIPADGPRVGPRSFDVTGALLVTVGSTLTVFVLVQGPDSGWGTPLVIVAAVLAVVLLAAFGFAEARRPDVLLPPSLLRNRSLRGGVAITALYMATFGTLPYFLTLLLQTTLHLSALLTGLGFLVPAVAILAGTQLGERAATRFGARTTLAGGFAIGLAGTAALALGFGAGSYLALLPGLIVSGIGQGLVWTAMFITVSTGVAPARQGVANGLATTTLNLGEAVGLALLVVVAHAAGNQAAVAVAAAGMAVGLALALGLPGHRGSGRALDLDRELGEQPLLAEGRDQQRP